MSRPRTPNELHRHVVVPQRTVQQKRHHRDPHALDEETGENVTAHSTGTTPSSLAKHSRLAVSRKSRTKGWPAISRVVAPYRSLHSPFLPMRRAITYS